MPANKLAAILAQAKLPGTGRPRHTLLYVTRTTSYWLDVNRGGQPVGEVKVIDKICDGVDYLPETVAYLFTQGVKPARQVWLLYDQLETYTLNIPTAQVHGLGASALMQALCFEIEALTGSSVVNRALGFTLTTSPDEEMRSFWVSLLPQRIFDQLEKTLKQHGARLSGVAHPGGLPCSLGALDPPWLRVEYWPEMIVAVAQRMRQEPLEVTVVPLEGLVRAAEKELNEWLADHPASVFRRETLFADGGKLNSEAESGGYHLAHQQDLSHWLVAWGQVLIGKTARVPVIQATARIEREHLYWIASGAFGLLLVGLHASWQIYLKWDYEAKTAALQQIQTQLETIAQGIQARTEKLNRETQAVQFLEHSLDDLPPLLTALKARPARLLEALAHQRPDRVVLTEIETIQEGWIVRGISVDFTAPNAYAAHLESSLASLGVRLYPPRKTDLQFAAGGGPWRFEMKLEDLGLTGIKDGLR